MTLADHLNLFYKKFNIPKDGGVDFKYFEVPLPYITLKIPNYSWRKKALHIHDLEHILNNQDTSWQGEIFIASWEISTGFWRNFPVCIFPLWTMGWGLWYKPKSVIQGFKKGSIDCGIANLQIEKIQLLNLKLDQLKQLTINKKPKPTAFKYLNKFTFWVLISQIVFAFPGIVFLVLSLIFAASIQI